jgi:hypothetical protein
MTNNALREFVSKATDRSRVNFGDVRRLQRKILPDGVMAREEAELLIALDRSVAKADPSWTEYLVATIVDFVVWVERPTGFVDDETALWLAEALSAGGAMTRTARLIAREIAREAQVGDDTGAEDEAAEIEADAAASGTAPAPMPLAA